MERGASSHDGGDGARCDDGGGDDEGCKIDYGGGNNYGIDVVKIVVEIWW